jgi:uncharacterized membrane protein (GlpM family)
MEFLLKLCVSNAVIILCVQLAKKLPSLAGLIATMPLAGLIVLVWVYTDRRGDFDFMLTYTRGALWGILPSIAFYLVALLCFSRHLSLPMTLAASFAVWLAGAVVHQRFLG